MKKKKRIVQYFMKMSGWEALLYIVGGNRDYKITQNGIYVDVSRRRIT